MKTIKKVSITPVQSYEGQIIDSMTTSSDNTKNAPSIHAVQGLIINNPLQATDITKETYSIQAIRNYVAGNLPSVRTDDFTFTDTTTAKTFTVHAYKYGKVVTLYFDFNIQAGATISVNSGQYTIPVDYRPQNIVSLRFGESSTSSNLIALALNPNGNILGVINGADNESGSYIHDYPTITYVVE